MFAGSADEAALKTSRRAQDALAIASQFKSCDIVWVKLFSFPWWPGTVFDRSWMCDEQKYKRKAGNICIRFFGTYEVCYLIPDGSNLFPYADFPDGHPPPADASKRGEKIQERRQQDAKKYKLALHEASLLFKEVCDGDKNIVPIFWGVSREQDRCQICGSVEDPLDSLLLCDQCDTPWHMECLSPALIKVPDGDWYCPDCSSRVTRRTAVLDELFRMRIQMGLAKRPRGFKDSLPLADDEPQVSAGSAEKQKRRYRKKQAQEVDSLAEFEDLNVLFAASQQYRPLPLSLESIPANPTESEPLTSVCDQQPVPDQCDDANIESSQGASGDTIVQPLRTSENAILSPLVRSNRISYLGAKITAPEMALFLGISRVRVYQLIKAGLPLTSFEEASAWRSARKPGHPRKVLHVDDNRIQSNAIPIPGNDSSAQESKEAVALTLGIKKLAQVCMPEDPQWENISSVLQKCDQTLQQLSEVMQRGFGVSFESLRTPRHIPLKLIESSCGELARSIRSISQNGDFRSSILTFGANPIPLAMIEVPSVDSPTVEPLVSNLKSPDKTPKKIGRPCKQGKRVEVVVTLPAADDEHLDGFSDWIAALLNARHLLPGGAKVRPKTPLSRSLASVFDPTEASGHGTINEADSRNESENEASFMNIHPEFGNIEASIARVPLDTRSQFIQEARNLCETDLRNLRGILRPHKRRHKHRPDAPPEEESSDICFLCLADYHDELILLCDGEGCNRAAHMFCLTPPLLSVPSGKWLCPVCAQLEERTVRYETLDHNKASVLEMEAIAALSTNMD